MKNKRLIEAYDAIRPDPERSEKILAALEQACSPERETITAMKTKKILHIALAAAVLTVFCAVTAFAVPGIVHSTGTHIMDNTGAYTNVSDLPTVEKIVGYAVKAPESLPGGYAFARCSVGGEAAYDENNEVLKEYYGVAITYEKDGQPSVSLNLSPVLDLPTAREAPTPTGTRIIDGVEVRCSLDHYKLVPEGYEKTAEDRAAEAAGHFYISYGAERVEERDYAFASFTLDGVEHVLMAQGNDSVDTLYAMAAEVIAAQ